MDCPSKENMQGFIDGELAEEQSLSIIKHIRSCDTCKTELREILALCRILDLAVSADRCPSLDALENYAACTETEKDTAITEHIEFCHSCRSYVWAFSASDQELADWQKQEALAYDEFKAKELGYNPAREALQKLMPTKIELLDKLWQATLTFVLGLKDMAMSSWPSFNTGTHLVGALGFAEEYDPENDAASVILATTVYISQAVNEGQLKPCQPDLETAVRDIGARFGAGRELQRKLVQTIPPLVLRLR